LRRLETGATEIFEKRMFHGFSPELQFVLCGLATWRLTHLIVAEDGPWDVVVRLRARLGDSMAGQLMDCFYCSSVWIAIPFALIMTRSPLSWFVSWLALSGAASLLQVITSGEIVRSLPPPQSERKNQ